MMGHKICFYGDIWLIIPKLSLLPLLLWSSVSDAVVIKVLQLLGLQLPGLPDLNCYPTTPDMFLLCDDAVLYLE